MRLVGDLLGGIPTSSPIFPAAGLRGLGMAQALPRQFRLVLFWPLPIAVVEIRFNVTQSTTSQGFLQCTFLRSSKKGQLYAMSVRTLEARLEHLSVNDENEPANNGSTMLKSKVKQAKNHSKTRR